MKFITYNFCSELKQNIENKGFKRPTDIQYKAIPPILKGEDVLAVAQTGTGKTAAFAIPIIEKLQRSKETPKQGLKCLILVPTRELALQINSVFEELTQGIKIKTLCIFGGIEQDEQINKLQKEIDILIATPGRMFDLNSQGYLNLKSVATLVLDEADRMLDLGFLKDIFDVKKHLPPKHQTLFFSATINPKIKKTAYSLVKNPIRIQISPKNPVAKNIDHSVAFIEMDDKRFFLEHLIKENNTSKILVFVRTKVRAERVANAMLRANIESLTMHSDKNQKERFEILNKFKENNIKVLITTDLNSRGIDIPNVDYVINYDLPEQTENYVHRVGRTGRANKKGYAISFCSNDEKPLLKEIENYLEKPIETIKIEKNDYQQIVSISEQSVSDWKTLIKENEENLKKKRKKR